MNLNSVTLTGNLVRDPEARSAQPSVCAMRIAVNERRKVGEEWQDHANYINITAFGKLADNCLQYLDKGRGIAVLGSLRWHAWEQDNGDRREAVEVIARQIQFLSRGEKAREEGGEEGEAIHTRESSPSEPPVEGPDEDAPF